MNEEEFRTGSGKPQSLTKLENDTFEAFGRAFIAGVALASEGKVEANFHLSLGSSPYVSISTRMNYQLGDHKVQVQITDSWMNPANSLDLLAWTIASKALQYPDVLDAIYPRTSYLMVIHETLKSIVWEIPKEKPLMLLEEWSSLSNSRVLTLHEFTEALTKRGIIDGTI